MLFRTCSFFALITYCVFASHSRDGIYFPTRWRFILDHYDYPDPSFDHKMPGDGTRTHVPTVQDSLQNLQDFVESDVRDYATSHIVDMKLEVTGVKYSRDTIILPKQKKVSLAMISETDQLKFVPGSENETFILPKNYNSLRTFPKTGFKSSFGVTRLSSMQNTIDSEAICREVPKAIPLKECSLIVGNGTVECEWKLGLQENVRNRAYATVDFKIVYEKLVDSKCIREKWYTVSVVFVGLVDRSVNRSVRSKVNVPLKQFIVFRLFPRIDIKALLNGTNPEGTVDCASDCTGSRAPCKCDVQLSRDPRLLHKLLQMVDMGLSLVADGKISEDTYRPDQKRKYKDFVLYWDQLTSLDLSDLSLKSFNNDYLLKVSDLKDLSFANTGVLKIPESVVELHKLNTLNLSGNADLLPQERLAEILQPPRQLKNLDLSDLPLKTLDHLRERLISMKPQGLYLRNCSLTTVDNDLFVQLSELVNLDLSNNPLGTFPQDLVAHLPNLKVLGLSSINLQSGPAIFLGRVILQKLDLSNNRLVKIGDIVSSGFIYDLDLKGNQIKEWDREDIFLQKGMPWAKRVNLAHNQMEVVTEIMGKSLQSLDEVELGGNPFDCTNCRVYLEMRKWLLSDKGYLRITTNGKEFPVYCGVPAKLAGYPIVVVNAANICSGPSLELVWLLMIPIVMLCVFLVVYAVVKRKFRYQLKHMQYMDEMKKKNRRRAATLHEKHFEYDVYLVYSPEDANFAKYLKMRLEKSRYRVLVSRGDFDAVSDEVQLSRHVVVVVTNNLMTCDYAQRGVERTNFWLLSGDFHNIILLMMEGVNKDALPPTLKLIKSQHDHINWRTSLGVDELHFQTLLSYLGPSNFATWQAALRQSLEVELSQPPATSGPQAMRGFFSKTCRKQKKDVEPQISSLL